jgi:hypothetical protein
MDKKIKARNRPRPKNQQAESSTLTIGACTLGAGEFVRFERTYIILGMD